jgi:hypothetical protein
MVRSIAICASAYRLPFAPAALRGMLDFLRRRRRAKPEHGTKRD